MLGISGAFSLFAPRALIAPGDAAATAERIREAEPLFRLVIASELTSGVMFILVALALYHIFRAFGPRLAALMVIFVVVSIPITFVAAMSELATLTLLSGASFLSVFEPTELDAVAYVSLRVHSAGLVVASVFWGLWLVPLGMLGLRSGFVPRVVSILVIVAGVAYVVASFASVLLPEYASVVSSVAMILEIGEFPMIVWLLLTRVRVAV